MVFVNVFSNYYNNISAIFKAICIIICFSNIYFTIFFIILFNVLIWKGSKRRFLVFFYLIGIALIIVFFMQSINLFIKVQKLREETMIKTYKTINPINNNQTVQSK